MRRKARSGPPRQQARLGAPPRPATSMLHGVALLDATALVRARMLAIPLGQMVLAGPGAGDAAGTSAGSDA